MRKLLGVIFSVLVGVPMVSTEAQSDLFSDISRLLFPPGGGFDSYYSGGGSLADALATQQYKTFQACIGQGPFFQDGTGCPTPSNTYPHIYYYSCDFAKQHSTDTDIAAAKNICVGASNFGVKRERLYGGHICGYIIDTVYCFSASAPERPSRH
ncbi:MAG: hypothetical protein ACLPX7_20885 [Xanthobacteraceae bacterium]